MRDPMTPESAVKVLDSLASPPRRLAAWRELAGALGMAPNILTHPLVINRPIVVTPLGTRLCRPSELVLDILPDRQKGAFAKEDAEQVVDAKGQRLK